MINNRFAFLSVLLASSVSAGEFEAVNVARSGSFELDVSPDKAIHLFTAPGEILWAPGWDPEILSGDGTQEGNVWLTRHGGESTTWIVVDFNVDEYRARYARVTQGSRAGTVEVRLSENDQGGSTVNVTYAFTALSESGNQYLAHFTAEAYAEMLTEWDKHIRHADIDYSALVP